MYKLTEYFGWLNLVVMTIGLMSSPWIERPEKLNAGALVFILILGGLVASAIIFASRQKAAGTDIGDKAYPATLAAYILWAVTAFNWFG